MTPAVPHLVLPVSSRDHAIGAVHAPITLVQYGDYQCSHCAAAHLAIEEIVEALDHKLRYVYRHFPLTGRHPRARAAAEAAEAAGAQARFWEMHERLFAFRDHLDDDGLIEHARRVGLDVPRFARALSTGEFAAKIEQDRRSAEESGVDDTPAFFINGVLYDGPYDLNSLLMAVQAAIATS
jgi:protein-disulfide isomerase